jgi:hypothetical protein
VRQEVGRIVDHLVGIFFGERVGVSLVVAQRNAIARHEEAVLPGWDLDDRLHRDVVKNLEAQFEMEARWQDFGLRPLFALRGDDRAALQIAAEIDLVAMSRFVLVHEHEGQRRDEPHRNEHAETAHREPCGPQKPVLGWIARGDISRPDPRNENDDDGEDESGHGPVLRLSGQGRGLCARQSHCPRERCNPIASAFLAVLY